MRTAMSVRLVKVIKLSDADVDSQLLHTTETLMNTDGRTQNGNPLSNRASHLRFPKFHFNIAKSSKSRAKTPDPEEEDPKGKRRKSSSKSSSSTPAPATEFPLDILRKDLEQDGRPEEEVKPPEVG